jgi:hypothetical protein
MMTAPRQSHLGGIGSGLDSLIPVMPLVRWRDIYCTGGTNETVSCHDAVLRIDAVLWNS